MITGESKMDKKPLIVVSICVVVLLVLGSLSNVVGYQTVKSLENHAPNAPDIIGPEELKVGISYLFTFVTTDPDGDNVSYTIDWGDGTVILWIGPYKSGQEIHFAHTWTQKGTVYIKAKAKDLPYEDESTWTIHPIRWSYSLSPQINYQNNLNNVVNQKELLFQTIVDIANNKEIQRIILKSQINRGIFPTSEFPVVTKTQIRQMYFLGLILSKVISKSRMQSMVKQQYQFINQAVKKDLSAVVQNDAKLMGAIQDLSACDCNITRDSKLQELICDILLKILSPMQTILYSLMYYIVKLPGIIISIVYILYSTIYLSVLLIFAALCMSDWPYMTNG
jgi:hypothetical protein